MIPGIGLEELIRTAGYAGLFGIVFAETGLLVGFFLPGDSLLFTAGFLASQGVLDVRILIVVTFVAAVAGDQVGYMFGRRVGVALYQREESFLFRRSHLLRTEAFFERHGGKVIVIARVIPFARTFAPIVAGVGTMPYRRFVFYNLAGGFAWTAGFSSAGYFLGRSVPHVDRYVLPIVGVIILVSVAPALLTAWRELRPHAMAALAERRARGRAAAAPDRER
ncbi:MAG: DedA family protein [Chloroflexi bacterium]|nr:DedA family protein [Chloroflexota bacterium]